MYDSADFAHALDTARISHGPLMSHIVALLLFSTTCSLSSVFPIPFLYVGICADMKWRVYATGAVGARLLTMLLYGSSTSLVILLFCIMLWDPDVRSACIYLGLLTRCVLTSLITR